MTTTDQTVLDAAVRIVDEVIASTDAPFAEQVANDVFATLARAGWLHDPARVAALEAVTEAARVLVKGDPEQDADHITELGWTLDTLDALPAKDGAR